MLKSINTNIKIFFFILLFFIPCNLNCYAVNLNKDIRLSNDDLSILKKALKQGDKGKWSRSLNLSKKSQDSIVKKIVEWRWLSSHDGIASFEKTQSFYINNPSWPKRNAIRKNLENRLINNNSIKNLLWFQKYPPISGQGKIKFAESLIKNNFLVSGNWLIRRAWIEHNFSFSEEKYLLKKYKQIISSEDHNKRLDRLIWQRTWGSAKRQLKRVKNDIKKLGEARIILARRRSNADKAVSEVPSSLKNNESLVYERVRWRRKAGLRDTSMELLLNYKNEFSYPKKWWYEIRYHARKQISKGNMSRALMLVSNHRQKNNTLISEAEWLSGWLSLKFTKEVKRSYEHFTKMFSAVSTPISKARAAFWSGKAAEALEDTKGSVIWYKRAATFPSTFYGQLALKKLNKNLFLPKFENNWDKKELDEFTRNDLLRASIALIDAGHQRLSKYFIMHLVKQTYNSKDILMLTHILKSLNKVPLTISVAKKSIYNGMYMPSISFPLPELNLFNDEVRDKRVSLPVALAIARQESAFNPTAKSSAGALGMMQLMPRTARLTAKKLKLKYSKTMLTKKPKYNIKLGTKYFGDMLEEHSGSYVLALASYNAGPNRVKKWLKHYGDPRKNEVDPIDWIELIPIKETRNYVQRVVEGIYMYRMLVNNNDLANTSSELKLF